MSPEPTFPADAVPGRVSPAATEAREALPSSPAIGAHEVTPEPDASAQASDAARTRRWQTGVAIGVGSAAIAAALIYANRPKPIDRS